MNVNSKKTVKISLLKIRVFIVTSFYGIIVISHIHIVDLKESHLISDTLFN